MIYIRSKFNNVGADMQPVLQLILDCYGTPPLPLQASVEPFATSWSIPAINPLYFPQVIILADTSNYQPRSEGDNVLGSVRPSVRPPVCGHSHG